MKSPPNLCASPPSGWQTSPDVWVLVHHIQVEGQSEKRTAFIAQRARKRKQSSGSHQPGSLLRQLWALTGLWELLLEGSAIVSFIPVVRTVLYWLLSPMELSPKTNFRGGRREQRKRCWGMSLELMQQLWDRNCPVVGLCPCN